MFRARDYTHQTLIPQPEDRRSLAKQAITKAQNKSSRLVDENLTMIQDPWNPQSDQASIALQGSNTRSSADMIVHAAAAGEFPNQAVALAVTSRTTQKPAVTG